jgi:hypothetical protein
MSRIAQEVLTTLFMSLEPDAQDLVRTLTRNILRLPLTPEERDDYVAGFILHAVDAQTKPRRASSPPRDAAPAHTTEDGHAAPPIHMATADVVRELVHSTPPPDLWHLRKASGEN